MKLTGDSFFTYGKIINSGLTEDILFAVDISIMIPTAEYIASPVASHFVHRSEFFSANEYRLP